MSGIEGAPLGEMLADIKRRCLYFNRQDILKRWRKLGIMFDIAIHTKVLEDGRIMNVSNVVVEALTIYKQYCGHIYVPLLFKIDGDKCYYYPKHLHGMNLGSDVHCIRKSAIYVNKTSRPQLEALGVIPALNEV